MSEINYELKSSWPKLAWIAVLARNENFVKVMHGPMVEIEESWAVEGVWDGDFSAGDFDKTDIIFGSGIRLRENKAIFVSSASTFDRLLYCKTDNNVYISNSLPALLNVSDLMLRDDYIRYAHDNFSIVRGLEDKISQIPTTGSPITKVYYKNLEVEIDGLFLKELPKPDLSPAFDRYVDYRDYLFDKAKLLGENLRSTSRVHKISPLSTISKGYDSCAASVVSKYAGCEDTVTISKSSSVFGISDSGKDVAGYLGMTCREYPRTSESYPNEVALWAGEGRAGVLNWSLFEFPEPLTLLFTGCHGEKVWDRVDHDHPDPFVRRDTSSHGFCELRLIRGVFQVPVPFLGIQKSQQIRSITHQEEMKNFYMGEDYDKPIARRLVEEAGVPRNLFGVSNRNTSLESPFRWPFSKKEKECFEKYLSERKITSLSPFSAEILRFISKIYHIIYLNFGKKLGLPETKSYAFKKIPGCSYLYQWANHTLIDDYYSSEHKEVL